MKHIVLAAALALLAGCAGYKIGPVQPTIMEGVTTIGIPTFTNETLEPRIEVLVTGTVIKQFHQDGTYQIVSDKESDVVLEGTITRINRRPARQVRGNVIATREFDFQIYVNYKVYERVTGKELAVRQVMGQTNFFVGTDLQQDERQAVALAAEEAAVKIVSQLSEGW